jgi:hypothetical protein
MKRISFAIALLALTLSADPAYAQAPAATHMIVRLFKCSPQGEAVARFQEARPVIDQMIAEGKFLEYGILTHSWGDEWNVVDYIKVAGLSTFFTSFAELAQRLGAAATAAGDQGDRPTLGELCTEHRDNIYAIAPPPAGA